MGIPEYIINAAMQYSQKHGGGQEVMDAFIAGYKATKAKQKSSDRVLTEDELKLFDDCWKAYGRKGSKKDSLECWKKLTREEMAKVMPHLRVYCGSREFRFQKDFQRYLAHKLFNDVITDSHGTTLYEPAGDCEQNEYHPLSDGLFQYWDETNKRLVFNGDIDHLVDGYSASNRPDGARAAWGMYEWVWNASIKDWIKQ